MRCAHVGVDAYVLQPDVVVIEGFNSGRRSCRLGHRPQLEALNPCCGDLIIGEKLPLPEMLGTLHRDIGREIPNTL